MTHPTPPPPLPQLAAWPRFVGLDLRALIPSAKRLLVTGIMCFALMLFTAPNVLTAQLHTGILLSAIVPLTLFRTDEHGLELLSRLLPIRLHTRVTGRYATVLLSTLAATVIGTLAGLIATFSKAGSLSELPAGFILLLASALLLQAVQLPVLTKLGIQQAQWLSLAIMFAIAFVSTFLTTLGWKNPGGEKHADPLPLALLLLTATLLYGASALLSCQLYTNRKTRQNHPPTQKPILDPATPNTTP